MDERYRKTLIWLVVILSGPLISVLASFLMPLFEPSGFDLIGLGVVFAVILGGVFALPLIILNFFKLDEHLDNKIWIYLIISSVLILFISLLVVVPYAYIFVNNQTYLIYGNDFFDNITFLTQYFEFEYDSMVISYFNLILMILLGYIVLLLYICHQMGYIQIFKQKTPENE